MTTLHNLGYRCINGAWRYSGRQAVFIGDLIDRGPLQVETVNIARSMVDAGSARIVLGNHEFNAIAWATRDPDASGEHLRRRTGGLGTKNRSQHAAFLDAVGEDSALHAELAQWFTTIPLWLDLGGLRVVHACWDHASMDVLRPLLNENDTSSAAFMVESSRRGQPAYESAEILLKGPEVPLPDGFAYCDKDGHPRHRARFAWWNREATTLRDGAEIPSGARSLTGQPFPELPVDPIAHLDLPRYTDDVPVSYGHYWRTGNPTTVSQTTACVDYSAGKGDPLVAYRWSGEPTLSSENFVLFPDS